MVFYFVAVDPKYILYMGKDKYENEELIKWAFPEDIWFHVDDLSSAHVYLRLPQGHTMDQIPPAVLEDCIQLVKANSIQGNKQNNLSVVYTPASNLKKTAAMDVGQVGFKDEKLCRHSKVSARDNAIVNRLNKTKEERHPNLQALREERDAAERQAKKKEIIKQKELEAKQIAEKKREQELRSYTGLVDDDANKISNRSVKSAKEFEDDFM